LLLRCCFELPSPIQEFVDLIEPEVLFSEACRAAAEQHLRVDDGILHVLSPGDIVSWCHIQENPCENDDLSMIARHVSDSCLRCSPLMFSNVAAETSPSAGSVWQRTQRYALRRDFPRQGCHTAVKAPCSDGANPDEVECYNELDGAKAMVAVLTSTMQGQRTLVNSLVFLDHGLTVSHLLTGLRQRPRPLDFFAVKYQTLLRLQQSSMFRDVLCGDADYIMLVLRRCSRGPPLLPTGSDHQCDGDDVQKWIQAPEYNLCTYLRALFAATGVQAAVFSSYRGSAIMPYQAVMLRQDWERSWPLCTSVWLEQKKAYRRIFGGKSSPDIHETTEVRCGESSLSTKYVQHMVPISHTFVHFKPVPLCSQNRARSDSAM